MPDPEPPEVLAGLVPDPNEHTFVTHIDLRKGSTDEKNAKRLSVQDFVNYLNEL